MLTYADVLGLTASHVLDTPAPAPLVCEAWTSSSFSSLSLIKLTAAHVLPPSPLFLRYDTRELRQHTSAYVSIRQLTYAYVSIRQQTYDTRELRPTMTGTLKVGAALMA
jgi:hypothetical protein